MGKHSQLSELVEGLFLQLASGCEYRDNFPLVNFINSNGA